MKRVLSVVLAVALAAAAVALQNSRWSYGRAYGPFVKNGQIGRTLTEPHFTVRVEQVRTAATITIPATSYAKAQTIPASGVFVAVIATVAARRSPVYVAAAALRTRYGVYYPTDKLGGGALTKPLTPTLDYERLQPGMPRRGAYVFDVPAAALAGARLQLSDRDTLVAQFGHYRDDPERFSAEAHIDLRIDAAEAGRLTRAPVSGYRIPGLS